MPRFTDYNGLYFDDFAEASAWLRDRGSVRLPPLEGVEALILRGDFRRHPEARGRETVFPGLAVALNGKPVGRISAYEPGTWELRVPLPRASATRQDFELTLRLTGVAWTNALAWLGRVTGRGAIQRFRGQRKNRQLRVSAIATDSGEIVYDFSQRQAPYSREFIRRHARLGLNIAGFLTADLGLGESARCMVRAADAAGISTALVSLKLHCRNRLGDPTYAARLREDNPHPVNVVHVDPPASRDIDHHHGRAFRAGKYSIAYFAWELPEFPDAWMSAFDHYDEVWCPSEFTREAVSWKSPRPVMTMPHAISFARPPGGSAAWRARFHLPEKAFLFLTLYDLNSYTARKNPLAAIEAFRLSGLAAPEAGLVVKVQNSAANPADFRALEAALAAIPGAVLINATLPRADVYALESACDAFVSLHRSEGFGLAVAECMYLGKPAIATDWSATAEYVTPDNGCPVRCRLVELDRNHGPYSRGATWADADPAHAAEWMRLLAADRPLAARLGAAARATIEARFAPAVIGARYQRRLEAIATF